MEVEELHIRVSLAAGTNAVVERVHEKAWVWGERPTSTLHLTRHET